MVVDIVDRRSRDDMQPLSIEGDSDFERDDSVWRGRRVCSFFPFLCEVPHVDIQGIFSNCVTMISHYVSPVSIKKSPFSTTLAEKIVLCGNQFIDLNLYSKDDISSFYGEDYVAVFNNALYDTIIELFTIQEGSLVFRNHSYWITSGSLGAPIYACIDKFKDICLNYDKLSDDGKKKIIWYLCCDEEKVKEKLSADKNDIFFIKKIVSDISGIRITLVEQRMIRMSFQDNMLQELEGAFGKLHINEQKIIEQEI